MAKHAQDSLNTVGGENTGCYQYFGIRSHLHHFYDYEENGDDDDDAANYLLQPKKSKRCSPILWKILLWFGINTLVFGIVSILVGHLTPRQPILHTATVSGRFAIVDRKAAHVNLALDVLGIVGIVSFCVAGVIIVVAIILPTHLNEYCFEDQIISCEEDIQSSYFSLPSEPPSSPIDTAVPVTQVLASVQPTVRDKRLSPDTPYQPIE